MWDYLIDRALRSAPAHLLGADPDMLGRMRRFAGKKVVIELPGFRPPRQSQLFVQCEFAPDGEPRLTTSTALPEDRDLLLRPKRSRQCLDWEEGVQGDRRLALQLLATFRRFRPDWEEGVEFWLGAMPAGLVAQAGQWLKDMRWPHRNSEKPL